MSLQAFLKAKTSVNMSIAAILRIISVSKINWSTRETLFQSLAISVLFYGIEVWGLKHLDKIYKIQFGYYKKVFDMPKN